METTASPYPSSRSRQWLGWLMVMGAVGAAGVLVGGVFYYVIGWSERKMAPVRVGMSREEVKAVLGEPRALKSENGITWWSYGEWWTNDANVFFDDAGRVRAIETD